MESWSHGEEAELEIYYVKDVNTFYIVSPIASSFRNNEQLTNRAQWNAMVQHWLILFGSLEQGLTRDGHLNRIFRVNSRS